MNQCFYLGYSLNLLIKYFSKCENWCCANGHNSYIAYQYLWSCDMDVGDPSKSHLLSCKRSSTTLIPVWMFFWHFQALELSLLISTVCYWMWWCVFTLPSVLLPLCLQALMQGERGGKGSDQSSQGSWGKKSPRWIPHFFCWQGPPTNPVANIGTYRAKYGHI